MASGSSASSTPGNEITTTSSFGASYDASELLLEVSIRLGDSNPHLLLLRDYSASLKSSRGHKCAKSDEIGEDNEDSAQG